MVHIAQKEPKNIFDIFWVETEYHCRSVDGHAYGILDNCAPINNFEGTLEA